jgi:phage terminase Nu1 subunit (DNA packaging protein)
MAANLTWPADRMSKFIDVSPRRLAQLVQEGVVERAERGRYNPFAVTVAYIRWLRDQRSKVADTEETKKAREAKEARWQQQIDEAAMVKAERELVDGKTVYRSAVRDQVADVFTKACQIVRQSRLSEREQKELVRQFADIKLDPVRVVEFPK